MGHGHTGKVRSCPDQSKAHIRMRTLRILTLPSALFAAVLLLAGCTPAPSSAPPASQAADASLLAELGLADLDGGRLAESLDAIPLAERPEGVATSITAREVTVTDGQGRTEEVALPADSMYVSAAPYLSQTHDCYYHSPTGCVGELRNTEIDVTVTNATTGEIVLTESTRTFDNGFVGLWLPRGIEAHITITHAGKTATSIVSTIGDDAQTCVTTLKLA